MPDAMRPLLTSHDSVALALAGTSPGSELVEETGSHGGVAAVVEETTSETAFASAGGRKYTLVLLEIMSMRRSASRPSMPWFEPHQSGSTIAMSSSPKLIAGNRSPSRELRAMVSATRK